MKKMATMMNNKPATEAPAMAAATWPFIACDEWTCCADEEAALPPAPLVLDVLADEPAACMPPAPAAPPCAPGS